MKLNKPLWEMTRSEWDVILLGYKMLLRDVKKMNESSNPHVWNEICHSAKEIETQINLTIKQIQILSKMNH